MGGSIPSKDSEREKSLATKGIATDGSQMERNTVVKTSKTR